MVKLSKRAYDNRYNTIKGREAVVAKFNVPEVMRMITQCLSGVRTKGLRAQNDGEPVEITLSISHVIVIAKNTASKSMLEYVMCKLSW